MKLSVVNFSHFRYCNLVRFHFVFSKFDCSCRNFRYEVRCRKSNQKSAVFWTKFHCRNLIEYKWKNDKISAFQVKTINYCLLNFMFCTKQRKTANRKTKKHEIFSCFCCLLSFSKMYRTILIYKPKKYCLKNVKPALSIFAHNGWKLALVVRV
mgnify:CR=1 FL=1